METFRERAFWVEGTLTAKALGWEHAWKVQTPARSQGCEHAGWGREERGRHQVREITGVDTQGVRVIERMYYSE